MPMTRKSELPQLEVALDISLPCKGGRRKGERKDGREEEREGGKQGRKEGRMKEWMEEEEEEGKGREEGNEGRIGQKRKECEQWILHVGKHLWQCAWLVGTLHYTHFTFTTENWCMVCQYARVCGVRGGRNEMKWLPSRIFLSYLTFHTTRLQVGMHSKGDSRDQKWQPPIHSSTLSFNTVCMHIWRASRMNEACVVSQCL